MCITPSQTFSNLKKFNDFVSHNVQVSANQWSPTLKPNEPLSSDWLMRECHIVYSCPPWVLHFLDKQGKSYTRTNLVICSFIFYSKITYTPNTVAMVTTKSRFLKKLVLLVNHFRVMLLERSTRLTNQLESALLKEKWISQKLNYLTMLVCAITY